jgi:DNA-binding Lrp family transcriptional regulator
MTLDDLDRRIVTLFTEQPQIGVLGASRELGVARGTVQARLDRLVQRGVIRSWAPQVDPAAMGYPVSAFCTLEIRQGRGHSPVVDHLSGIPEVLEAHTITGSGDLLIRVVARDNADLQRVIDDVVDDRHVIRASTVISLATRIPLRTLPLVQSAGAGVSPPRGTRS